MTNIGISTIEKHPDINILKPLAYRDNALKTDISVRCLALMI
jgi:hypothetical protein